MVEEKYICPDCNDELTCEKGCGSVSYFCNHCKKLISSKRIICETKCKEDSGKAKED